MEFVERLVNEATNVGWTWKPPLGSPLTTISEAYGAAIVPSTIVVGDV